MSRPKPPRQAQTSFMGHTATTTYSPATVHQYVKPGQDTYIRILSVAPGQPAPAGAFSAEEIVRYAGSRVKRPD
jgi:hypothetical protein